MIALSLEASVEAPESALDLESALTEDLPCGHRDHADDRFTHSLGEVATVRGYAPCGYTLNICERFSIFLEAGGSWIPLACHCGDVHRASELRLVKI